jgi:hypothetical protein
MQASEHPRGRRSQRVVTRMPVRLLVELHGQLNAYSAHALDISPQGLRIRTDASLKPGQTLQVVTVVASSSQLWSRVVWVGAPKSDREGEAGLEFLN